MDTAKKNVYKTHLLEPAQRVSPDVGAGVSFSREHNYIQARYFTLRIIIHYR